MRAISKTPNKPSDSQPTSFLEMLETSCITRDFTSISMKVSSDHEYFRSLLMAKNESIDSRITCNSVMGSLSTDVIRRNLRKMSTDDLDAIPSFFREAVDHGCSLASSGRQSGWGTVALVLLEEAARRETWANGADKISDTIDILCNGLNVYPELKVLNSFLNTAIKYSDDAFLRILERSIDANYRSNHNGNKKNADDLFAILDNSGKSRDKVDRYLIEKSALNKHNAIMEAICKYAVGKNKSLLKKFTPSTWKIVDTPQLPIDEALESMIKTPKIVLDELSSPKLYDNRKRIWNSIIPTMVHEGHGACISKTLAANDNLRYIIQSFDDSIGVLIPYMTTEEFNTIAKHVGTDKVIQGIGIGHLKTSVFEKLKMEGISKDHLSACAFYDLKGTCSLIVDSEIEKKKTGNNIINGTLSSHDYYLHHAANREIFHFHSIVTEKPIHGVHSTKKLAESACREILSTATEERKDIYMASLIEIISSGYSNKTVEDSISLMGCHQ